MYYINVNNVSNCGISISSIISVKGVTSRVSGVSSSLSSTTRDHCHRMTLIVGRRNPCDHDHCRYRPPSDNNDDYDDDDDDDDDDDNGNDDDSDDTSSLLLVS